MSFWKSTAGVIDEMGYKSASGTAEAVGGGATVREIALADWPTRLADYTWADGDLAYVTETKAYRKYDGTAADLVLPHLYGTIATLHESLLGDVVPGSAGWTETEGGTGLWSAAGGLATATSTGSTDTCFATGSFATGSLALAQGLWNPSTRNSDAHMLQRFIGVQNGVRAIYLRCTAAGLVWFTDGTGNLDHGGTGDVSGGETWIEIWNDANNAYAHVGVSAMPVAISFLSLFAAVGSRDIYLGDATTNSAAGGQVQTFRQWNFWSRS